MAEMDYVRILRDLREDADKTQTQIAEVLGTSQTMYARYERRRLIGTRTEDELLVELLTG